MIDLDCPFMELLDAKESLTDSEEDVSSKRAIGYEIISRINTLGGYCDRFNRLTPLQQEVAEPCLIHKMGLHAVRRVVEV